MKDRTWWLVADIGGTNARFWAVSPGSIEPVWQGYYLVSEYPEFGDVLTHALQDVAVALDDVVPPEKVCFAVACPTNLDRFVFTNSHWNFSMGEVVDKTGCQLVSVINDFGSVARAVMNLEASDLTAIGDGQISREHPKVVLGAGTGLGVAGLVPSASGFSVIESEGGHADYAPVGDLQVEVKRKLRSQFNRVCIERVLSGPGLVNVSNALAAIKHQSPRFATPADIVAAALSDQDELARDVLEFFCDVAGAVAGNLALTFGAKGGVYIVGGVIPRFSDFFIKSGFRSAFEDKGRFRDYLTNIPVFLVQRQDLGLIGAVSYLKAEGQSS